MKEKAFVDYYEVLQVSQGAEGETLERVYRLLAKRYHPDNQTTGNSERFGEVHEAYEILSNAKARAAYDVKYDETRSLQWKIFDQSTAADGRQEDRRVLHGVLSLLYVARRRDPARGGLGIVNMEKLLGVPRQHLEFPIWYLRQKGWVEILDNGQFGITVSGVDKLADRELALPEDRLLAASSVVGAASQSGVASIGAEGDAHALGSGDATPKQKEGSRDSEPEAPRAPVAPQAAEPVAAPDQPPAPAPKFAASSSPFPSESDLGATDVTEAGAPSQSPAVKPRDEVELARDRARVVAERLRNRPA